MPSHNVSRLDCFFTARLRIPTVWLAPSRFQGGGFELRQWSSIPSIIGPQIYTSGKDAARNRSRPPSTAVMQVILLPGQVDLLSPDPASIRRASLLILGGRQKRRSSHLQLSRVASDLGHDGMRPSKFPCSQANHWSYTEKRQINLQIKPLVLGLF